MFVSTLIPTFIHLYLFLYSLMALESHHQKELVAYDLADYRLTNCLRIHIGAMVVLSIGFVVLLGVLVSKIKFGLI